MPRRDIQFIQHHYYHIYNRGAGKHNLFIEDSNYLYVLRQTKKQCHDLNLSVIAYCLMPNHYHYLLRQDGETPVNELPKRVFGGYSRAVFKRYEWSGTLFEGRFQARHIDNDHYLRHLCRYIHANPVKDGIVQHLEEWPWSNYLEWVDLREGTLVNREFIANMFPEGSTAYQAFVHDYLVMRQLPRELEYLQS